MTPSQLPEFRQCIDHSRPFELLDETARGQPTTLAPEKRHSLRYRYTDNGEIAVVPNAHYNQTPARRAAHVRHLATERAERAATLKRNTPRGMKPWMAKQLAERLLLNAHRIRQVADEIESGAAPWDAPLGLEQEALSWPPEQRELDAEPASNVAATLLWLSEMTHAPLTQQQFQQLREDAEHVERAARRKGLTLTADELREETFTAQLHFDLGCWLHYYRTRVGAPVSPVSTRDHIDCLRRLFEDGVVFSTHERFLTVFDFGSRHFEQCLEMPDANEVVDALLDHASNFPGSKLADSVRAMQWRRSQPAIHHATSDDVDPSERPRARG